MAVAHWYVGTTDNGTPLEKDYPYWNLLGNGGILSTADDMLRWHDALAGDHILDDEAKALYYAPHVEEGPGAGTHYGYGWAALSYRSAPLPGADG